MIRRTWRRLCHALGYHEWKLDSTHTADLQQFRYCMRCEATQIWHRAYGEWIDVGLFRRQRLIEAANRKRGDGGGA